MSIYDDPDYGWMLCQDCGMRLYQLSDWQRHDIKFNPYNYVSFCWACRKNRISSYD